MDKKFIDSLRGLSESELEKKLKEFGYSRCSAGFTMINQEITKAVLPRGNQTHKEVLFVDYSIIKPQQYDPHQCYAIFVKD